MRATLLAFLLLGTACSLNEGGGLGDVPEGGPRDQLVPDASDPSDGPATLDAGVDAPTDAPPPPDGGCTPSSCPGERCVSGACDYYASCKDMRQDTTRQTGAHKLRDTKNVFDAWCDMSTDGGGWTLVGRSVALGSSTNFGWKKSTGNLGDDFQPYSLDANAHDLVFTEALVGSYTLGKGWFGSLYKVILPAKFLADYKSSAGATTVSKIGGACGTNSPDMLTNMGFVDNNDEFFLRNNTSQGGYGLRAGGFSLAFGIADCVNAGYLDSLQGMIFVR